MGAERIAIPLRPAPSRSLWDVAGHAYEFLTWTPEDWDRTPPRERPDDARPHGDGWAALRVAGRP
jgi:hypothetical protein